MSNLYSKNFDDADEVKTPPKARVDIVQLGNINASKLVLQPGWVWSECIKPTVGGHSCQVTLVLLFQVDSAARMMMDQKLKLGRGMLIILRQAMMVGL